MPSGETVDSERKQRIIDAHIRQRVPVSTLSSGYKISGKTIYRWIKEAREATTLQRDTPDDNQPLISNDISGEPSK